MTWPVNPLGPEELEELLEEDRRAGGAHGEEGPEPVYPALRRHEVNAIAHHGLGAHGETELEEIDRSIVRLEAQIPGAEHEVELDRAELAGRVQELTRYREELGPEAARLRSRLSGKLHLLLAVTIAAGELVAGYAAWLILDLARFPTWMLAAVTAAVLYGMGSALGVHAKEHDIDVTRARGTGAEGPGSMAGTWIMRACVIAALAVAASVALLRSFYVEHASDAEPVSGPLLWLAFGAIPIAMFVAAIALEYFAHDREARLEAAVEPARRALKGSTARLADLTASAAGERAGREHAERRQRHFLHAQDHVAQARCAALYSGYVGARGEPLGDAALPLPAEPVIELEPLGERSSPGAAPAYLLLPHLRTNGHGRSDP